jgi:hypothetical protein
VTKPRIQLLDDLGAEFARVAADREHASRHFGFPRLVATPRRTLALALAVFALGVGGVYSVPPTRAAIEDVTSSFAGWVAGDNEQAPGDPADADAPSWVRTDGGRLIAKTDGVPLYVTRTKSGDDTILSFVLGATASGQETAVAGANTVQGWREVFDQHAVVVLGALPPRSGDESERFPLMGVTARSVDRIELRYASGPPLVATNVDGGFVLMADATRPIQDIVAFGDGRELERTDVTTFANP